MSLHGLINCFFDLLCTVEASKCVTDPCDQPLMKRDRLFKKIASFEKRHFARSTFVQRESTSTPTTASATIIS